MSSNRVSVAIAILYRQSKFLLQLRDDIPGIVFPGHWGLFGGHIEPEETPVIALQRELQEEIGYTPTDPQLFMVDVQPQVIRHVFQAPLTVEPTALTLAEGWDFDLLTPAEIQQGQHFSPQAGRACPIGPPHQRILLHFLRSVGPDKVC